MGTFQEVKIVSVLLKGNFKTKTKTPVRNMIHFLFYEIK
jgi:hypothetical protein